MKRDNNNSLADCTCNCMSNNVLRLLDFATVDCWHLHIGVKCAVQACILIALIIGDCYQYIELFSLLS